MTSRAVAVHDPTDVAEARRVAARLTADARFDEEDAGRVALVVTEMASNLLKHAGGGEVIVRAVEGRGRELPSIEVLTVDRGPGMKDVTACLEDGYSTAGSQGTGLGAVRRASAEFSVYSIAGEGSVLLAEVVASGGAPRVGRSFAMGAVSVSHPGEYECGDAWACAVDGTRAAVIVADGLGHGHAAALAARAACDVFLEHSQRAPAAIVERVHAALRSTRGAAVAVTAIDEDAGKATHCGLGNVSALVVASGHPHQMISMNGTAGHEARKIREFEYAWPAGALFIAHSDGLHGRWRLDTYRGLDACDPRLVAAVLYRDARRGRDDATVCALRGPDPQAARADGGH